MGDSQKKIEFLIVFCFCNWFSVLKTIFSLVKNINLPLELKIFARKSRQENR